MALGAGLRGPMEEEDFLGPCGVLLWWLEDWLPPECPTPPWSRGFVPGVQKIGIRGIQDTRQIIFGKTIYVQNNDKN